MFNILHWIPTTLRRRRAGEHLPGKTARRRGPIRLVLERLEDRVTPTLSFAPAASFGVGHGPYSVAVGDFNRDGIADLATANYGANIGGTFTPGEVSVLLGNGSEGFDTATNFGVAPGTSPYSVAVGDFNGDGIADLAIATYGDPGNFVNVLLGNGSGAFSQLRIALTGESPDSVAVGDFNGDGKADVATANFGSTKPRGTNHGNVSVLLGDGSDGFQPVSLTQPPPAFETGDRPSSVAVGDFNGDGKADLAVANSGSNNVSVLLGNGSGAFGGAAAFFGVGDSPYAAVVGDFNGDGRADLATANHGHSLTQGNVSVLLGDGSGGFGPQAAFETGYGPSSVVVGDFNGDGIADLAVANSVSNNVSVLLGDGSGAFGGAAAFFGVGDGPSSMAVGDFNGDGNADLVTANRSSNSVSVLLNTTPVVDLKVTQTESASHVTAGSKTGSNLTYVVTVQNTGLVSASGVVLSEMLTLPAGVTLVGAVTASTGSVASCGASDHTWNLGSLAMGASATLTVNLRVSASVGAGVGAVAATATIKASNENRVATTDDSATERTSVDRKVANVYYVVKNERLVIPNQGPRRGVLANDRDAEGDTLTAELVSGPSTGKLRLNADGTFTFVPKRDFKGAVTFYYRTFDGTQYSDPVKVTIVVFANA